jgi:hypothetical protein
MVAEQQRDVRKAVVRVRFARPAVERLAYHALRFARPPEAKQDRREHAVGANTHTLAGHRSLGKLERLGKSTRAHQSVRFEVGS